MRGTNGGSRYAMPFRIVPDLGQRPEYSVQSSSKQRCHVLQQHIPWLTLSNHANGLEEQATAFAVKSCPAPGVGNILTRESCCDEVHRFENSAINFGDIAVPRHIGPMLGEDFSGIVIDFYLPTAFHPGTFKAEIDAADTCEE